MPKPWPNGARAAISLSYDDGLPEHPDAVAPALEKRGFRGTFYVPGSSADLRARPEVWRRMAAAGHELGNHSLFHPCRRTNKGMEWVKEHYDLSAYNEERIADELRLANLILSLVDGRQKRSYGATCCQTTIGVGAQERSFVPVVASLFTVIRGATSQDGLVPQGPPGVVPCVPGDNRPAAGLLELIDRALGAGTWLVLMFHGLGDRNHRLHITPDQHEILLDGLAARGRDLHVAPVTAVAEFLS